MVRSAYMKSRHWCWLILGEAKGHEIALVAESIRTAVHDRFGIEIMPEVKYVG